MKYEFYSIQLFFRWYDFWIGAFWDHDKTTLYICPIPMFGIRLRWKRRAG